MSQRISHNRILRYTEADRPINWFVEEQVGRGRWTPEELSPATTGLPRPHVVYWQESGPSEPIAHAWHGDATVYCPTTWWDAAISSGSCGLACRFPCYLLLTHRVRRDPMSPVLYRDTDRVVAAIASWLKADRWRSPGMKQDLRLTHFHVLGLSVDRGDSLLYEAVLQYMPRLAPRFASPATNPQGRKLLLLTKTANTHLLDGLPAGNVVVAMSLNPEAVADLVEGKYPCPDCEGAALGCRTCHGSGAVERISSPIARRLEALKAAQDMGFEVRVRIRPDHSYPGLARALPGLPYRHGPHGHPSHGADPGELP